MVKKRTLNEIRQEKNYGYKPPIENEDKEVVKPKDELEAVKELIVNKLQDQFFDIIFQAVNDEMQKYEEFQSQTYLTEEGYDLFEDEWFQFYHEHHGDILHEILQDLT